MYYLHHQDMHIAKHIILGKKIGKMTKPYLYLFLEAMWSIHYRCAFFTNKMVCIKQLQQKIEQT